MSNKNIIIRTDASIDIGTGHVMRCLALAQALTEQGATIYFVCQQLAGDLVEYIKKQGYETLIISGKTDSSFQPEINAIKEFITKKNVSIDWMIVDHYQIDESWEALIRPYVNRIAVIDDLANRAHDCDLLIDYNYFSLPVKKYQELVPKYCTTLLGTKYAILRSEFETARSKFNNKTGSIKHIVIFFGGTDPSNVTEMALNAVAKINKVTKITVVIGASNPNYQCLVSLCNKYSNIECKRHVDNFSQLMLTADLFIGAGGTTTWERACLAVPSIVISIADNQENHSKELAENGYLIYLGCSQKTSEEAIRTTVESLMANPLLVKFLANASASLVDGRGTRRVVRHLLVPYIDVRRATEHDFDNLLHWRNAEETRKYIFNRVPTSVDEHKCWFDRTLNDPKKILLIGEISNKPIGVIRYDLDEHSANISIYLVPGKSGNGLGAGLLKAGEKWLKKYYPHINTQVAQILPENIASIKMFENDGYAINHITYNKSINS